MKVKRVFTALLLVAGVASPCVAADNAPRPAQPAAAHSLIKLSPASLALLRAAQQAPAAADSTQFFKTKKGATVVALLVAGFAYTLYSRFHDELKSPIREQ